MQNFCEGSSLHQTPIPSTIGESEDLEPLPPSPIRENEDLEVLGDLEYFTIVSTRTLPPIWESKDLDVLRGLENFTIASTRKHT